MIPEAAKELHSKIQPVFKLMAEGYSFIQACKQAKVQAAWVTTQILTHEDLRRQAVALGVELPDIKHREADSTIPVMEASTAATKPNTRAVEQILSMLRLGASFRSACGRAGVRDSELRQWLAYDPDLIVKFKQAEGEFTYQFYQCLTQAMQVAATRGNIKELLELAGRRFPELGAVQPMTRQEARETRAEEWLDDSPYGKEKQGAGESKISITIEGELSYEEKDQ